jgi:hypothetical protein
VDDGGQRHPPPGDAAGGRAGPDARLPALGQPSVVAQDDGAALSGHPRDGHPRGDRRRRHPGADRERGILGQARAGGRRGRGAELPRRERAAGTAEAAGGGDRAERLRLRVRRLRHLPRCLGRGRC